MTEPKPQPEKAATPWSDRQGEWVYWEDVHRWITREQADRLTRGLITGDWS